MQFPLEVGLQPSRTVMASVLVAHVAAALALFHVPLLGLASVVDGGAGAQVALATLAWATLTVSLWRALRAERRKRDVVLWLEADGLVEVLVAGVAHGALYRVRPHTAVVLGWAVWFRLEPVDASQQFGGGGMGAARRHMLVAANLRADGWRRLRIWLRHRAEHVVPAEGLADSQFRGG